jgi:hypothetical protein
MQKRNRSDMDGEDLALSQVVSQLGPQPPDVVLYCIVKVGGGEVIIIINFTLPAQAGQWAACVGFSSST